MNRNFNDEDIQMANEHIKICSTLTKREIQMKTSKKSLHRHRNDLLFFLMITPNAGETAEKLYHS